MVLQKRYDYKQLYAPVFARGEGMRSPRSFLVDKTRVSTYTGADGTLQRLLPPGVFAGSIPGTPGKVRALPRTVLTAAAATNSATLTVSPNTARFFVATEALAAIPPYAVWTVTGTWAANDTAIVTVFGRAVTVTAADNNLSNIATQIANGINADPVLNKIVRAIASGAAVFVYALDMRSTYPIATGGTRAGAGTLPITGSLAALAAGASIGTISAVNVDTHTITLAATASIALPVGFPIGVLTSSPADLNGEGLGMLSPNNPIDLEWAPDDIQGAFIGGTVYRDRLPYWDGELANLFPELTLV